MLSVSVDPSNDTPATLAAFARRMEAELPGWRFATGDPNDVERLIRRMQVLDPRAAQAQPADHRTSLYLFDGSGTLIQRYRGVPVDRARLTDEVSRLHRSSASASRCAPDDPQPTTAWR
jgi:protein SCO1/2